MANQINTRIRLKYDSFSNWQTKNPVLLSGEIAIAYLGPTVDDSTVTPNNNTHPVLFKVGPGNFNSLPWASALAADVYSWAKAETVEYNSINQKIEFKSGATVTHSIDVSSLATKAMTGDLANLNTTNKTNLVNAINEALQAVEVGGTGSVVTVVKTPDGNGGSYEVKQGGKTVGDTITVPDAYTKTEADDAFAPKDIDTGVHSVSLASGTNNGTLKLTVDGSATDNIQVKGLQDAAYATVESLNATAKGYADAVEDKFGNLAIKDTITKNEIDNFATEVAAVKVTNAGTADKVAHSFTVNGVAFDGSADKTVTIDASSLGLESAMHFIGALTSAPASAKPGDVYLNTATKKEYVYAEGQGWVELGDEGSHALKDVKIQATNGLEITVGGTLASDTTIGIKDGGVTETKLATDVQTKLNKTWQPVGDYKTTQTAVTSPNASGKTLAFIDTISQDTNGVITATKKNVDLDAYALKTDISALDSSVSATAEANNKVSVLTGVTQTDGKLTAKTEVTLAAVAKTGSIYDLNEVKTTNDSSVTEGDYLVFYCGSATEII